MSDHVHISKHPLVLQKLTQLRNKATEPPMFRMVVADLARLLFAEASHRLRVRDIEVVTPNGPCIGFELADRIGLVPVLRAGLGMADAIHAFIPEAKLWHFGARRDEHTFQPIIYYDLPPVVDADLVVVLDPMLATGGSATVAVERLKQRGVKRVKFIGLIAAPDGVRAMRDQFPDVPIFLGALDEKLNSQKFIVPGLGDAGDRQFGTGT